MGLMTILRKVKAREREMRILVLGLDNAGKTTIMKRLKGEDVHSVSPTLGFDINTLEFDKYKLNMWDVGGQQTIRTYWRNYFEQTDGIIWVVDSADVARLSDCRAELETILMEERLAGASLLVLANKQDLSGALTTESVVEHLALNDMIGKKRHWQVFPSSALAEDHTADVENLLMRSIEWLVHDIASRILLAD
ncbi:ADP-ribosylation factor-like protein 2 [Gracilariopsis chorda]|uniref:ADP-ribosylation factor-like protein 2 n=1 Tax=Gracilariopsis chorda TaxID=448386 RepID=A0A2V3J164_9FLOR|nr:ADP-ribosylation factor-like protein 2 [Gracilariopsis chorda]|eukprot:PXF48099.1 ADP-ribosylation factor-like protein 2 [Gracilariopsis chorda]